MTKHHPDFGTPELNPSIDQLQASIAELESRNQQLLDANERLASTNEQLLSIYEQFHNANAQYQTRIDELVELTADMAGLLLSTQVRTILLDQDLCIRRFTPKIAETFQLVDEDIGRRIDSFTPWLRHPGLIDDINEVMQTQVSIEREVPDLDGRCFLLRILPYFKGVGCQGIVLTLIDVSQVRQSQAELQLANIQFRDVLENSPSLVYLKDPEGRYQIVNRMFAEVLGCSIPDVVGKTDHQLFPPELAEVLSAGDRDANNLTELVEFEELLPHPDGTKRTYLATKFRIQDQAGQTIAVGGIKTDVTPLKAAEARAVEAVQQRDRFLAVLSHELRNPLGALVNAVSLLSHEPTRREEYAPALAVIRRQSVHMARLLDDLLDVSRVTANKIEMRFETFDLRDLVDESVEAVRAYLDGHQHDMRTVISDEPLMVFGDRARLLQVVENLLNNATKYTQDGGWIELAMQAQENEAIITVSDNGRGISSQLLDSVFDMFVQSDETLHRSAGGMGVGLTLVRSLVERHSGSITVQSEGVGQGCGFEVRLPLASPENAPSQNDARPTAEIPQPPSRSTTPLRLVIVEDQPDNREMLRKLLELHGCQVSVASDGQAGLELIANERPDIAIVDIGLPSLDGYEIARRTRMELGNHAITLIALTGYGRDEDRRRVIAAGFDTHVVKPIKPHDIEQILQVSKSASSDVAQS